MTLALVMVVLGALDGGPFPDQPAAASELFEEPVDAGSVAPPTEAPSDGGVHEAVAAAPTAEARKAGPGGPHVGLRAAAEVQAALFPSALGSSQLDVFADLRPVVGFSVGEVFSIELGPRFRLRVLDFGQPDRPSDVGGFLRRADWDTPSDFGQILQAIRIGTVGGVVYVEGGAVSSKSMGRGHLVARYSNQWNPDYHPASATAVLTFGPVRTELFASDVLAARLFAGELEWDIGATFSSAPELKRRFTLALEAAHDAALGGLPFQPDPMGSNVTLPSVTLLHLDGQAVLFRSPSISGLLLGGFGSRVRVGTPGIPSELGFVAGGAIDARVTDVAFSIKLEARKQAGGFRHGYFGPGYELARYLDVGLVRSPDSLLTKPLDAVMLPDSWSFFAEVRVGIGEVATVDIAAEHFLFNRTDIDALVEVKLLRSWLVGQLRGTVVGVSQDPRLMLSAGVRARVLPALYVLGSAATSYFPQPDGNLLLGLAVSAGVGVDVER